jgi:hypothetical protein
MEANPWLVLREAFVKCIEFFGNVCTPVRVGLPPKNVVIVNKQGFTFHPSGIFARYRCCAMMCLMSFATGPILKFKKSGGRTTTYGRLSPDEPAYTINTYFRRPNVGCNFHYSELRLITPREAMRFQDIAGPIRN